MADSGSGSPVALMFMSPAGKIIPLIPATLIPRTPNPVRTPAAKMRLKVWFMPPGPRRRGDIRAAQRPFQRYSQQVRTATDNLSGTGRVKLTGVKIFLGVGACAVLVGAGLCPPLHPPRPAPSAPAQPLRRSVRQRLRRRNGAPGQVAAAVSPTARPRFSAAAPAGCPVRGVPCTRRTSAPASADAGVPEPSSAPSAGNRWTPGAPSPGAAPAALGGERVAHHRAVGPAAVVARGVPGHQLTVPAPVAAALPVNAPTQGLSADAGGAASRPPAVAPRCDDEVEKIMTRR